MVSYRDQKLWKFSSNVVCASLVVQLAPGGNEQNTINQITQYFKGKGLETKFKLCLEYNSYQDSLRGHP